MSKLEELPDIEDFMKVRVEHLRHSYYQISQELRTIYPCLHGLSERSIRRYCRKHNIAKTPRLDDASLDRVVTENIMRVGHSYGRKTMSGLLSAQGCRAGENRIGKSLKRVNPGYQAVRTAQAHRNINPMPYIAHYFGHKLHIDQNEKLVLFGVTHIVAIDGFSGKIVSLCSMPIKNTVLIYENVFRSITLQYGLWDQLRIDHGTEWALMLHVQSQLSRFRNDISKPPYIQTSSKQNHTVERLWVEVNSRVNYPIKGCLIQMVENGHLQMDDPLTRYCVSWYSLHVANVGLNLFVYSWNEHPLPGKRDGTARGVPNQRMLMDCRTKPINPSLLPTSTQAVMQYRLCGGQITETSVFGVDPNASSIEKCSIRDTAFKQHYPSFGTIFNELVNGNDQLFQDGLKFFIDLSFRLSCS